MLVWVKMKGEKLWDKSTIFHSALSGVLMLFVGTGAVIWAEQYLQSSFVAIFLASAPIWFLLFDKPLWKVNFSNKFTLIGVFAGLLGVIALFYEKLSGGSSDKGSFWAIVAIFIGNISWVVGSLYSKEKVKNVPPSVNSAWQIMAAGIMFSLVGLMDNSFAKVNWSAIPTSAWISVLYLAIFGSVIAYSAYVFLLDVRDTAEVSTYAYVNPVVAVVLGVFFNNDHLTFLQILGLMIILGSVFVVNIAKSFIEKRENAVVGKSRS